MPTPQEKVNKVQIELPEGITPEQFKRMIKQALKHSTYTRLQHRARQAALLALKQKHPQDFLQLYNEERVKLGLSSVKE